MDTMPGQQLDGLAVNAASGTDHKCYLAVKTECKEVGLLSPISSVSPLFTIRKCSHMILEK